MKNYFLHKIFLIKNSFFIANKGEENIKFLIWGWGFTSYVISYFIINKSILAVNNLFFDYLLSLIAIIFYVWHIYVLRKCSPKKPKLTKEEKKQIKIQNRKNFTKKFFRKLFLQEPLTKSNPVLTTIIIDLFCISHFLFYII